MNLNKLEGAEKPLFLLKLSGFLLYFANRVNLFLCDFKTFRSSMIDN